MCGIVGIVNDNLREEELEHNLKQMTNSIRHRGPDGDGLWHNASIGIGLGHTRLSVIDLSLEGHQPMVSNSGRFVIVYNGEVYNYKFLKKELEQLGHSFKSNSDTRVILQAIEEWGVEKAVKRFNGMFAIAVFDKRDNMLHLVRDRLGIKPLYYGIINDIFIFSSELKAIKACPTIEVDIESESISTFITKGHIPSPNSIYKNIFKLLPGHFLKINLTNSPLNYFNECYWSALEKMEIGLKYPFEGNEKELTYELEKLIGQSVKDHMVADVPLGGFLSGGIDSSLIIALMQKNCNHAINTFTVGFSEADYDETIYASETAKILGTNHTHIMLLQEECLNIIPSLGEIFDEPFADPSQIPTLLVSQIASKHVKVCLSGDGGDELFAGYDRYYALQKIWKLTGWLGHRGRLELGKLLRIIPINTLSKIFSRIPIQKRLSGRSGAIGDKLHKLSGVLNGRTPEEIYLKMMSHWKDENNVVINYEKTQIDPLLQNDYSSLSKIITKLTYIDSISYLPDCILTKLDRASMSASLEARVPLLDHRVFEFAAKIPIKQKYKNGRGKRPLTNILSKHLPEHLYNRPKMGFGVPVGKWLTGSLRDWAESMISPERLKNEGYFHPHTVRKRWEEHLSGRRNWQYDLWNILMFQAWLEKFKDHIEPHK
jgi:asparagine synthase (glutamine-hydrolysing)